MTTRSASAFLRPFAGALAAALLLAPTAQAADTPKTTTGSRIPDRPVAELDDILVPGGAVDDPADARAPEDTSVPALPAKKTDRRDRATTGTRIVERPVTDLDDVHVIGAVEDPAEAALPEDTSLPALPVVSAPHGR